MVYAILNDNTSSLKLSEGSLNDNNQPILNKFILDYLEGDRIYHINQIKELCITYRLRFLDSKYFKGHFPEEVNDRISELENQHNIEIKGLKIIAPSKLFKLDNKDDPLLFATMGNGYYYLIYKWGKDLHPLRKVLVWPFKNIVNLTILVLVLSYLLTLLVPDGLFSSQSSTAEFWMIFLFMFKAAAGMVIYYGFALGKNINPAIWNSRYYNA